MIKKLRYHFSLMDKWLLAAYLFMLIVSIIMVYSASSYTALQDFGNSRHYFIRQSVYAGMSVVLMVMTTLIPLRVFKSKKTMMFVLGITIAMLIAVFFGREINGAKRWIQLPFLTIQPGEIAKVVVVWYMAYILSKRETAKVGAFFQSLIQPLILITVMLTLIFLQPDTGTTVIIIVITAMMIFASGISFWIGAGFSAIGGIIVVGGMALIRRFGESLPFISGYRYDRFLAFWDPFAVSDSHGLQLVNSYYALSRGGLFGVGLGNSIQKTGYLPFPYTDFILAIVGEELGLIRLGLILLVFLFLILRVFIIGIRLRDSFSMLFCYGVGVLLVIQSLFNIGGVIGILPITGLTFPFLSYGGSSLLIMSFAVGLVLNISFVSNKAKLRASMDN